MIKILFVHHQLVCGGAEQALYDLLVLMDKSKFDITVLVQYKGGEWEEKFRAAGINIIYDYSCQKVTRNVLVKIENWYKRKKIKYANEHEGQGLLDTCFRRQFDIIVSYSIWTKPFTGFAKGAKTVKYIHTDIGTNEAAYNTVLKLKEFLPRYDRIVCVSEQAKKSFQQRTEIYDKVEMHFNPLDSEKIMALAEEPCALCASLPIVCAVGRLVKEKGYARLIKIHKNLLTKGIKHKLVIVGEGPERQHIEQLIADTKTQQSVVLTGYQSNPYPYMKKSAFLVCSSYTEGLPVIAMESLSLGIPVVSSVPSIAELFGFEKCGVITENDDDSLEKGMEQMLIDKEYYTQVKLGAKKRSSFFNGKRMVREVENMFMNLI